MSRNSSYSKYTYFCLFATAVAHAAVYIGCYVAMIMTVIYEPWYLSCALVMFFHSPALAGVFCAFTNLENKYRNKLGLETIPDDALSFYLRKIRGKGTIMNLMFRKR